MSRSRWRSSTASASAARTPSRSSADRADATRRPAAASTRPGVTIGPLPIDRRAPTVAPMTEVNGLRLAYRGFVTGLAASYVWLAVAMAGAAIVSHDALAPLTPLAATLIAAGDVTPSMSFVLGFALVQAAGALIGMCFAYFFGRFFTVRATVASAAPIVAVLAWALLAAGHRVADRLRCRSRPPARRRSSPPRHMACCWGAACRCEPRSSVRAAPRIGQRGARVALDVELGLEPRPAPGQRRHPVAQATLGGRERQLVPRDLVRTEGPHLARLGAGADLPTNHIRLVEERHDARGRSAVRADEAADLDEEAASPPRSRAGRPPPPTRRAPGSLPDSSTGRRPARSRGVRGGRARRELAAFRRRPVGCAM